MCNPFKGGGSGGGGDVRYITQKTTSDPWGPQQDPLKFGFGQARDIYESGVPQYYPGSTVTPMAPQTEQALRMTENRALAGNPLLGAAQTQAQSTLQGGGMTSPATGYYQNVMGGQYLNQGNPYTQGLIDRVTGDVSRSIDTSRLGARRFGSPGHAEAISRGVSGAVAPLLFGQYGQERGMQQQAAAGLSGEYGAERQRQMGMIGAAPGLAAADYADPQQLAAVGAGREAQSQAELADLVNRWNFNQNLPAEKLGQYMSLIGGGYGGQGMSTYPVTSSPGQSFLGGASMGAGIGSMLGLPGWGIGASALGGGMLGMY